MMNKISPSLNSGIHDSDLPHGLSRAGWFISTVLLLVSGLSLAALVGSDGSIGWAIFRVGVVIIVTLAAILLSARQLRSGACLIIVYGTVGVVIGIVFGLRYLMVDGLSWWVVAGLIDLAAGLALVVTGIRRLLFGLRWGWRLVAIPALVVAVLIIGWTLVPGVLVTNVPPIPAGDVSPRDFGLTAREVRFNTSDGAELFAWYVPSSNGSAVILRHGSGSTASDTLSHAAVLSRHGYGVLITDARGHGRSGGRAMDFGWYGDLDIEAAVSFLAGQPEINAQRIAVVGLSMGGEEALGATAADTRIAAVVAEGATARTEADKSWYPEIYGISGWIQNGIEWAQYSLTDLLTDASKPVALAEAVRIAAPRPILLIAAGEVEEEGYSAEYIQQQSPQNVTIWVVPGAGHIQGLSVAPAEWESRVTSFLDASLAGK